jgi:hypothetical protein
MMSALATVFTTSIVAATGGLVTAFGVLLCIVLVVGVIVIDKVVGSLPSWLLYAVLGVVLAIVAVFAFRHGSASLGIAAVICMGVAAIWLVFKVVGPKAGKEYDDSRERKAEAADPRIRQEELENEAFGGDSQERGEELDEVLEEIREKRGLAPRADDDAEDA